MDNLTYIPLPEHRGRTWLNTWWKTTTSINEEAFDIILERVNILTEHFEISVQNPSILTSVMDRIIKKYNTIVYEENGEIMMVDLFNYQTEDTLAFGLGDSPTFKKYIVNNYPELLV